MYSNMLYKTQNWLFSVLLQANQTNHELAYMFFNKYMNRLIRVSNIYLCSNFNAVL